MIYLDHYKGINDLYGYLVGGDCLQFTAQRIGKVLRAHDALLARFGGEEFVVGMPNHDQHDAVEVAESLRRALVVSPCGTQGHSIRISASVGVHTVTPGSVGRSDACLELADGSEVRRVGSTGGSTFMYRWEADN